MRNLQTIAFASVLAAGSLLPVLSAQAGQFGAMTDYEQAGIIIVSGHAALNPQPLPPRQITPFGTGDEVSLNPQPLPPKYLKRRFLLQAGN
jgi:hypothetical protein